MVSSGIYEIVNTVNGHRYVGSAVNITQRWFRHKSDLNKNKHHSRHLQRSWNKYGSESFEFRVLEHCFFFMLIPREQFYIDELAPEYNNSHTAGSPLGVKHTDETRTKNSETRKKYWNAPEARAKQSKAQKKRYENPKERADQSERIKKAKGTPEARAKASEKQKAVWARRKQESDSYNRQGEKDGL